MVEDISLSNMKNTANFGKSKKSVWLYISEMYFLDLVLVVWDIHDFPESIPCGKHQWFFFLIFRQNFMLFGDNLWFILIFIHYSVDRKFQHPKTDTARCVTGTYNWNRQGLGKGHTLRLTRIHIPWLTVHWKPLRK